MRDGEYAPFSRGPSERIAAVNFGNVSETVKPKIRPRYTVNDDITFIATCLAKLGYYGGDPMGVLNAPADMVEAILEYEAFESDYEKAYLALNAPKTGA